jgi:Tat protein secretion system quality control protein TatD with DNase activity
VDLHFLQALLNLQHIRNCFIMSVKASSKDRDEVFPWHLGVYDAHCHPTDVMSSVETIQNMKTRVLTVMATREQDQDLVIAAADSHSVKSSDPNTWTKEECIVPCFGWHPWFSHQMYITEHDEQDQRPLTGAAKLAHYQSVLQPLRDPLDDRDRATLLSLPDPTSFSVFLSQTRTHLLRYPHALVGEIGLDRSFRIPESWDTNADLWARRDHSLTPGGREGRRLTPLRCSPQHQKEICKLQLQLAAELGRGVSVHGVQAHGLVFEVLAETWKGQEREVLSKRERKKRGHDHPSVENNDALQTEQQATSYPYPPRICLHSYSGSASNFKQYLNPAIPARIFASFSTAVNLSDTEEGETPAAFEEVVKTVPDHMVLVESDLHTAGEEMDRRMEDIVRRVCRVKGWGLEEGVRQLGENWRAFAFGEA